MFQLSESFRTGLDRLDEEHRALIDRINEVAEAERAGGAGLLPALRDFRDELCRHFRDEEAELEAAGYPDRRAHAEHHAQSLVALDGLIARIEGQPRRDGGVAATCFHELISAVLLRDMEFVNWLADRSAAISGRPRAQPGKPRSAVS